MQITKRHSNVETTISGSFYMAGNIDDLKSNIRRKLSEKRNLNEDLTDEEWAVLDELNYEYDQTHLENEDYRDIEREMEIVIDKHD